jgi:hypothetical protein
LLETIQAMNATRVREESSVNEGLGQQATPAFVVKAADFPTLCLKLGLGHERESNLIQEGL